VIFYGRRSRGRKRKGGAVTIGRCSASGRGRKIDPVAAGSLGYRFRNTHGPRAVPLHSLTLIGSGCLVCLMPLALYLFFLASLNQRPRPTLVSGSWDFAAALLGLSGFLLVGGPVLLSALDSTWRSYLFRGNFAQVRAAWETNSIIWSTIAGFYLVLLGGGSALVLRARGRVTVIYNLDPATLPDTLTAALDGLGLPWRRVLGGYEIGGKRRKAVVLDDDAPAADAKPALDPGGRSAFVVIDTFPGLCHASLKWLDPDPLLRREVEAALVKALDATESPENPAGGWFMTASVSLFFILILWMAFLIYTMVANPRAV
jgi:hypothetical protein